jgi:hypothetical protein
MVQNFATLGFCYCIHFPQSGRIDQYNAGDTNIMLKMSITFTISGEGEMKLCSSSPTNHYFCCTLSS